MIAIYTFSMVYFYIIAIKHFDEASDMLLETAKMDLKRQSVLFATENAWIVQEPLNDNFIAKTQLEDIVNKRVQVSNSFNPPDVIQNYADFYNTTESFFNTSLWYTSPAQTEYNSLSDKVKASLLQLSPIHYSWRQFKEHSLKGERRTVDSLYYGFEEFQLKTRYPGTNVSIYYEWPAKEIDCEYFESGKMDYYDIRCRPFYRYAKEHKYPILYGPYFSPSQDEAYLATISQSVYEGDTFHGVMNSDIRLEFDNTRSGFL
jgi:hypothetical protein